MKDVKVVVGSNFGDEGKGLMTRHFAVNSILKGENPIIIFHNGTAQRGHTVDYTPNLRHVYHHFGSGTADGAPTFFADTFWVHPMEFVREYGELAQMGVKPKVFCDPNALVVTPFDMLTDHATEAYIALLNGEREYGSCGYGTWCATDRFPHGIYRVKDFMNTEMRDFILEEAWKSCFAQLISRKVDVDKLPEFKSYYSTDSILKKNLIEHFKKDLNFFFQVAKIVDFNTVYSTHDSLIFENGQGLGLDQNVKNDWHTTSNTGLINPIAMLNDKNDFSAEVCYVSRSYLTRHGIGPMEEEAKKREINADMIDKTNVPNEFQGSLRYGYLADKAQAERISADWSIVENDRRFKKTMAITHCNEFKDIYQQAEYYSDNPFGVIKR